MTKNTEERIPEEAIDPKSKIAREADAFLNAIAGGADEDEADEAAFLELNPNGQWAWLDEKNEHGLVSMVADAIKAEDREHRARPSLL